MLYENPKLIVRKDGVEKRKERLTEALCSAQRLEVSYNLNLEVLVHDDVDLVFRAVQVIDSVSFRGP